LLTREIETKSHRNVRATKNVSVFCVFLVEFFVKSTVKKVK